MKIKILPILAVASTIALVSCNDKKAESADTSTETSAETENVEAAYPIDTCVVSGEKLGSMGDPVVITHEGTEVRFCCDACLPKFKEDPEKYLAKLKE